MRRSSARRKGQKQLVVLVRPETSPDDSHGMVAATGIVTARGGSTTHAAVVARGLGLPCVAGVAALDIDLQKREMRVDGKVIKEGDAISIDGTTGEVFAGELPTIAGAGFLPLPPQRAERAGCGLQC